MISLLLFAMSVAVHTLAVYIKFYQLHPLIFNVLGGLAMNVCFYEISLTMLLNRVVCSKTSKDAELLESAVYLIPRQPDSTSARETVSSSNDLNNKLLFRKMTSNILVNPPENYPGIMLPLSGTASIRQQHNRAAVQTFYRQEFISISTFYLFTVLLWIFGKSVSIPITIFFDLD